ncbi:MAG: peptidylprolyl isomerase [Verrucomicrobia bacterium]|nr:peptidylprolyl isomerase [Verrucomicrobiota bacterium]
MILPRGAFFGRFSLGWSLPLLAACALLLAAGCGRSGKGGPKLSADAKSSGGQHAVLETDKGAIEIEFFPKDAPKAVENFRLLAEHGYYNGVTFHRIVKGFMLQGGDPEGTGRGGESAWGGKFADEIQPDSALYKAGYQRGVLAMANAGPNTNGSQFFIMHANYPLPPAYVIFGRVTKGLEVVDALAETPVKMGMDGGMSAPLTPPVIKKVTVKP